MDQKKEEILENHGKNLPHGQSIGDRPVDHHDLPPMMTKAQLANKADIEDLGEGHFKVTANGKTMNIVDETGYKRMPSPLERMLLAGNKHESTDFLNKYVFLPGVVAGISYAFYSFVSGFGNPNLTAMQQAKKMNGRVNGQLFGVTLMATAGALSTYQYKLDQQEQYEQYLKDKEIRERRERGEEL